MKNLTGSCRLGMVLSILLVIIMVSTLLPHEILAQNVHITDNPSEPLFDITPSPPTSIPPSVNTDPVREITTDSALIQGIVTDLGSEGRVLVCFEYSEDTSYNQETDLVEMTSAGSFVFRLLDLKPDTTYHYRATARNNAGVFRGKEATFKTLPDPNPTATPSPTPSPSPNPTGAPLPTPIPSSSPTPIIIPTPSPTPSAAPSPSPSPLPKTTPTPPPEPEKTIQVSKVTGQAKPDQEFEIKSSSGKIKLNIPKEALSKSADIELNDYITPEPTGMIKRFELNAYDSNSKAKISQFNKTLQITLQHSEADLRGLDIDSLRLYYLDDRIKQWVPIPDSKYDPKTKTLTASVNHFTYFGEHANPLSNGPGRIMAAQVDLYSGASTFNYPFELPPGPGGFQPKLQMTYNSGSADEMKNRRDMGSWVGIGWTFNLGRISLDLVSNRYYLELNGLSYEIISLDNTNFKTNPDQHFKITKSGNTWNLYDKDGTLYQFGGDANSQQYISNYGVYFYYRWDLNLIRDTNNNEAIVTYARNIRGSAPNDWVRSAYPEYLKYNKVGDTYTVQVQFLSNSDENDPTDGELRKDSPKTYGANPAPKVMETRKLNSIEIKVSNSLIRKYSFGYNTSLSDSTLDRTQSSEYGGISYSGKFKLLSITQYGADNISYLPATSFSYQDLQTYRRPYETLYSGNPGNPASFTWPHLTQINSGYGGSISFAYTQIPNNGANPPSNWSTEAVLNWTREVVTSKTVNPGVGTSQNYTFTYTGNPQYLGTEWNQKYRGFGEVRETDGVGNYIKHYFFTTGTIDGKDAEKLTGKEYKTQWYNKGNTLLREVKSDWSWFTVSEQQEATILGSTAYQLTDPRCIAISTAGTVCVTNSDGRILVYDANLNYCGSFSATVTNPQGIAISPDGYIYVVSANNMVYKLNPNGTNASSFSTGLNNPRGIAVSPSGYVYVANTGGNNILVYTSNGTHVQTISYGLNSPKDVAITQEGYIYVANYGNSNYVKYDINGNCLAMFPCSGSYPLGVGVSPESYLYGVVANSNVVTKFNATGTVLANFSNGLNGPKDAAVSLTGFLYVVNSSASYYYFVVKLDSYKLIYAIQLNQIEDSTGNKTALTRYTYDAYGNITTENQDGDKDTSADDVTIARTYNPNTTSNIINKIASEVVSGANGHKETYYYYDNQNLDNQLSSAPTRGNLTRLQKKTSTIESVNTYYKYCHPDYSDYEERPGYPIKGNKYAEKDPNGKTTRWEYETTYNTYPVKKTLPLNGMHEHYAYDPGTSNLLWQQDINHTEGTADLKTSYSYDTFKRLVSVDKPSGQSPDIQYEYNNWGTIKQQNIKTTSRIDGSNSLWQKDYFDGIGRVIQSHAKGENEHTIISSTAAYNNRGLVDKQYVSQDLLSSQINGYKTPESSWKYSSYQYDGLGRTTSQTNADGTSISNDYSIAWQTVTTNQRGFQSSYSYDAFGRLTQLQDSYPVITKTASNISSNSATLNGTLAYLETTGVINVSFEYGLTENYGNTTSAQPLSAPGDFSANLTGLTNYSTYHYRAKAVYQDSSIRYGFDCTFQTHDGWFAPTAYSASMLWYPENGYTSNNQYAFTVQEYGYNQIIYQDFNIGDSVLEGGSIDGIEVSVEGYRAGSALSFNVYLSWDGGASWTSAKNTGDMGATDNTKTVGSSSDKWGRFWSSSEFSNSKLRVKLVASGYDMYLDCVKVKVSYSQDTAAPTVTVNQAASQADPTTIQPVSFTVTFNEPVIGFEAEDVNLSSSTAGGSKTVTISGSGPVYTVAVKGIATAGTVIASIGAGVVTDLAGNPNAASTTTDNSVEMSSVGNTDWSAPTAYSAGMLLYPERGYTSNNQYANTVQEYGYNQVIYQDFNIGDYILQGGSIDGIEVAVEGYRSGSALSFDVYLSWDGGTSWTSAKNTGDMGATDNTKTVGSNSDKWGRTWSSPEFSNSKLRVKLVASGYEMFLDCVKVKVYYSQDSNALPKTNYKYDILGNLRQVIDTKGNTSKMTYDWLSRKKTMDDPDMGHWYYNYDNNGNLTSQTDAKSQATNLYYDALNRLKTKSYSTASGSRLAGWGKWIELNIDNTRIDSTLTHFPVLIHLSSSSGINGIDITTIFDELGNNSKKIAVTKADGVTQLYVEVEKWDAANKEAWLWVSRSDWTISDTEDTKLYLYFDGSHADNADYVGDTNSAPARSVWDSNFKAVYHMNDVTTSSIYDSTANSKHGAKVDVNEPLQVNGFKSKAQQFDGSDDGIDIANNIANLSGDFSIYLLVNPADTGTNPRWLTLLTDSDNLQVGAMSGERVYLRLDDSTVQTNNAITTGNWVSVDWKVASGTRSIYFDGEEKTCLSGGITANGTFSAIGSGYSRTSYNTTGIIDEVRISGIVRSSAWMKATNLTCRDELFSFGTVPVCYTYDSTADSNLGKGRRTGMSDGSGSTGLKYDNRGRLTQEIKTVDSTPYTTQFAYDGADRISTITYPGGEVVTHGYNGRGLPNTLAGSVVNNLVSSTLYNALGQTVELNLGNSTRTTFGYYGIGGSYDTTGGYYGRLWEIKTTKQPGGTPVLQDVRHTWDTVGNLTQRQNVVSSETEAFTYDFLDRLLSASGPYSESYTYNEIGNILSKNGTSYTYPTNGVRPHAVTAVGSNSYQYDANGNMTHWNNASQNVTWDIENRPVSVTKDGVTTTYVYDGDGNRIKKTVGATTTIYVNRFYEKTGSEITTNYYLGSKLIAVKKGSTLNYVHQDHLGSTSVTSDTNGTQAGSIKYLPFGNCLQSTGSLATDQLFTGQRRDIATAGSELYYYGARYYDPQIGRFISADTIVPNPANPQSLNRYSYCLNNPLKYIDPTGHDEGDYSGWDSTGESGAPDDYGDYVGYLHRGGDCGYSHWHTGQVFFNTLISNFKEAIAAGSCQTLPSYQADYADAGWGSWDNWKDGFLSLPDTVKESFINMFDGYSNLAQTSDGRIELAAQGFFIISGGKGKGGSPAIEKLIHGQRIHKAWMANMRNPAAGLYKEFRLPSGRRIDFLDVNQGIVYELKPNNPRALMEGQKQLNAYIQELQTMPRYEGIQWTGKVVPY